MFILFLFISSFVAVAHAQVSTAPAKKNIMYHDSAKNILDSVPYQFLSPCIITEHEWKEFQLDRLITILDRTKTSFGRWGLAQLLRPIADADELAQRKDIITFLIEHEAELSFFQQQLGKFHDAEKSLLAYWDKNDPVDKGAQQFYYSFPGVSEYLNDSSLALNGSVGTQMFDAWRGLLISLCLGGFQIEGAKWRASQDKEFDWAEAVKAGFREPFNINDPRLNIFKDYDKSHQYTLKDYALALSYGSWGDKYKIFSEGYTFDVKSPAWFPAWLTALVSKFVVAPKAVGVVGKAGAFLSATVPTLLYDFHKIMSIWSVGTHIVSMNQSLNQLHDRVVDVATCFNAIKSMNRTIKKYPAIAQNNYTTIAYNAQVSDCLKKLAEPRFAKKGSSLYSRGHVLSMHKEIKQIKKLLIPIMQSVAFLDAYCSIAQLYKESQEQPVKFSFPEFIPSQKPLFSYENAWLPLLPYKQAVANDLCLGDNCPGKIIITGPIMGGKSTLLKTYGIVAILAQSWFMVPATHGSQTLFTEIKTGFVPHEDLSEDLSKGGAGLKRMDELLVAMKKSDAQKKNILVLIDEPYSGLVDDEKANRIYKFGKDIAGFSYALVAIATHVKKPITLEADTQGIFGNYQVKINETSPGIFERSFKMEKGPATWWFEDADQRSRFVDWISTRPLAEKEKSAEVTEKAKKAEEFFKKYGFSLKN